MFKHSNFFPSDDVVNRHLIKKTEGKDYYFSPYTSYSPELKCNIVPGDFESL